MESGDQWLWWKNPDCISHLAKVHDHCQVIDQSIAYSKKSVLSTDVSFSTEHLIILYDTKSLKKILIYFMHKHNQLVPAMDT